MNLRLHIIFSLVLTLLAVSAYATHVDLGSAYNFALLAGSAITNTGSSVINGDVGVFPGTSVTGFPPGIVNGTLYSGANAVVGQAQLDLVTAYDQAANATPTLDISGTDLGYYNVANPLGPGVYKFTSSALLTGNLTLKGNGDPDAQWIFQIGSALTTATDSSVVLIDARMCQVYWQVGSSTATIGTGSLFVGHIMALTSISLNGGTLYGQALTRNGAVTISSAQTVNARCIPEPSSIMALGMMLTSAAVLFRRKK